jgi:hypothetical protein
VQVLTQRHATCVINALCKTITSREDAQDSCEKLLSIDPATVPVASSERGPKAATAGSGTSKEGAIFSAPGTLCSPQCPMSFEASGPSLTSVDMPAVTSKPYQLDKYSATQKD